MVFAARSTYHPRALLILLGGERDTKTYSGVKNMSDLFIKNCMLENGEKVDILILKGKIADISPFIQGVSESVPEIDAEGWLYSSIFRQSFSSRSD